MNHIHSSQSPEDRGGVGAEIVSGNPGNTTDPIAAAAVQEITRIRAVEDALRRSEARYRMLFESLRDPFVQVSMDGRIIEFNDQYCEMLGYTAEEMRKLTYMDITPERWHEYEGEIVRDQIIARGYSDVYVKEYRRKDGTVFPVELRTILARDEAGAPGSMWGIVRDISERKRAEQELRDSEARYRRVVENTTAVILRLDPGGLITYANSRALQFFGYTDEELIGRPAVGTIIPERDSTGRDLAGMVAEIAKSPDQYHNNANENMCKDGRRVWVEWTNSGIYAPDGSLVEFLAVGIDATERRRMEGALRKLNETLEQRVRDRTQALTESVHALNRRSQQLQILASELTMAEQRERRRLAQVLHDGLQQVLVASRMRLETLSRTGDDEARRRANEVMDLISESVEISRSLTAELSPPILHEGGLVPALEWLVRWMQDKQGLTIDLQAEFESQDLPEDLTILLFQSTRELLFNVVKHACVKNARVRVGERNGMLSVEVSDDGIGFDLTAVPDTPLKSGGFGLFSIRERIGLLGGRLEIDSAPGRGSRFTLHAPLACQWNNRHDAGDEQRPRASVGFVSPRRADKPRAEKAIRVMLVDDHLIMRQGLASLIREELDMEVIGEASDGEAAIRLARDIRPDVILMDVSMPRMNGIEATRAIRSELPDARVIGLSMFEEADRAEAMREAGAVNYLAKTGPSQELIKAIRECVRTPS